MTHAYSTAQAAKKLGLSLMSMYRYIKAKKIPIPPMQRVGNVRVRLWTEKDINRVRALLPKIANGRKTRYQKKHSVASTQQPAKAKSKTKSKSPPPRAAVPHKQRKKK